MKQWIIAVLLLGTTGLTHAGITCADYLANHEQLLKVSATVLAKKAPPGHVDEMHISQLHMVIEHECKNDPQRTLASVLKWFNGVIENEYHLVGGWLVFTPNGAIVYDNMVKS